MIIINPQKTISATNRKHFVVHREFDSYNRSAQSVREVLPIMAQLHICHRAIGLDRFLVLGSYTICSPSFSAGNATSSLSEPVLVCLHKTVMPLSKNSKQPSACALINVCPLLSGTHCTTVHLASVIWPCVLFSRVESYITYPFVEYSWRKTFEYRIQ